MIVWVGMPEGRKGAEVMPRLSRESIEEEDEGGGLEGRRDGCEKVLV